MKKLGEVSALWRYPVKSLAPESLDAAEIAVDGIPGDRSRALIVRSGHAREGKTYRGKEHNLLHLTDNEETAIARASERNVQVSVSGEAGHYFDAAPVSLIFDRWIDQASALVGYPLDPLRFRPNIFIRAAADFCGPETDFVGLLFKIGNTRLRVRKPIERCVTTTYDQKTGESDPAVLRQIAQRRDTLLGLYCDVEVPGPVRLGDEVNID